MKLAPPHDRPRRHPERIDGRPYLFFALSGAGILSLAWLLLRGG
jgi:hypothetical protein